MRERRKKKSLTEVGGGAGRTNGSSGTQGSVVGDGIPRVPLEFLLGGLLILCLTFISYFPALSADFIWDDAQHFGPTRVHPSLKGLTSLWIGHRFYYPLTSTTFWIIRLIWDMNPIPYHLLNVILHGVNSILVWRIARRLGMPLPFLCGLLFSIHPVHVQSVAWATELKNTQSGFFYLLAIGMYLRFDESKNSRMYLCSLAMFLFALLSKTSTVTLPFIIVLMHVWLGRGLDRTSLARFIPYFGLSGIMGGMTVLFHQDQVTDMNYWDETLVQRMFLACRCIWFYIQKFMWPSTLTFVYPRWDVTSGLIQWLGQALALVGLAWVLWRHSMQAKSYRAAWLGLAGFVASLLPVLNIFKMYYTRFSYTADHWQYLADMVAIPLAVGLIAGILRVGRPAKHRGASRIPQWLKMAIVGLVCFVCVIKSAIQCYDYKDMETLWRNSIRKNPNAYLAHVNIALLLTESGRLDEAHFHYTQALTLDQDKVVPNLGLGRVEFARERYEKSKEMYERVLTLKPNDADALNGLAGILVKDERFGEAMTLLDRAGKSDPRHAETFTNRGRLLDAIGKKDEAVAAYTRAIDLNPDDFKARQHLADDLRDLGRYDEAIAQYSFSIQLNPRNVDAALSLGGVLGSLGNYEQALGVFLSARESNPSNAGLAFNIGVTLKKLGRIAESESYFLEAARLDPQFGRSATIPAADAQD